MPTSSREQHTGFQPSLIIERVTSTLREQVVARLRAALTEGVFRPGERMVERDICERLNVSRPLIREALRQLTLRGWLSWCRIAARWCADLPLKRRQNSMI